MLSAVVIGQPPNTITDVVNFQSLCWLFARARERAHPLSLITRTTQRQSYCYPTSPINQYGFITVCCFTYGFVMVLWFIRLVGYYCRGPVFQHSSLWK